MRANAVDGAVRGQQCADGSTAYATDDSANSCRQGPATDVQTERLGAA